MQREINVSVEKKQGDGGGYFVAYKTNHTANFTIICLLIVLMFNSFLSTILIVKYNIELNQHQANLGNIINGYMLNHNHHSPNENQFDSQLSGEYLHEPLSQKLVDSQLAKECICPTLAPPVTIITNKDPVSILNEQQGVDEYYDWRHLCKMPPIHTMTLTIEDVDGEWVGTGNSKKSAKHEAAYKAIKEVYPHLLDQVVYEPIVYNPQCTDRK